MKTMACKQLYGPCDVLIHGESAEEMVENIKKHGMEMAAKGDEGHIKVIEAMKPYMNDPELVKQFMEKFQNDFAAIPDDK